MSPRTSRSRPFLALGVLVLCAGAGPLLAQPAPTPGTHDELLEGYLTEQGLTEVLAAHYRAKLEHAPQDERLRAAEALGKLYVRMLTAATTPEKRQKIESDSRQLLKVVPEAESFELRISLAKATYLQAEEAAERVRLRMASEDEKAEAQRVLRVVGPQFTEMAGKLDSRVRQLERRETVSGEADVDAVREMLAEARRLRSLARYYAGWAEYYTAYLTNTPARAHAALDDFGTLLNAVPGKAASVERAPKALMRYEHVARAAIGCAMASSLLGNDEEADRWIDALENAEDVPKRVMDELFRRRLVIDARSQRWADIQSLVERRMHAEGDTPAPPLTLAESRTLAVLALEASSDSKVRDRLRSIAQDLAQLAMSDLIAKGEIGHVLSLVSRYGTAPIGDEGFIASYVRGVQAFEAARNAHQQQSEKDHTPDEPTSVPEIANLYHHAAEILKAASEGTQASAFPTERSKASIMLGLSLYYANELSDAAEVFERAFNDAKAPQQRQDALWYAIVALDRAEEGGKKSVGPARDRLATLFFQEFPMTERATTLLLRRVQADKLGDTEAIKMLLAVPENSPLYFASRRRAASILYKVFRVSPSSERDFAALRFAEIVEGVIRTEQAAAVASRDQEAQDAARALIIHCRQLADAILSLATPDVKRAEAALEAIRGVADFQSFVFTQDEQAELDFRRLQIALAKGDQAEITRATDRLRAAGGQFGAAADRLMFRKALRDWRAASQDVALAKEVVRYGTRVLDSSRAGAADAQTVSLRDAIAEAAGLLWHAEKTTSMRDLAVTIDLAQLDSGRRTSSSLRRLAELVETQGKPGDALGYWQELLLGLGQGTPEWFEARYHSIRLLISLDPPKAAEAMQQLKAFYPDLGPEPWKAKLQELESLVPAPAGGRK